MTTNNANITINAETRNAVERINELNVALRNTNNTLVINQQNIEKTQSGWVQFAYKFNQSVDAIRKSYQIISSTVKYAFDFGKEIAAFESAERAFKRYADSVGVSSESVLNKLQNVSGGVIDNLKLMQSASNAMAKGVTTDINKMGDLMRVASQKAKIFGKDGGQVFDDLVNAISKGSEKMLAEVGVKLPEGFDKMTKGMSKTEKQAKILEHVIESGKKEIAAMGGDLEDSSDAFARFDTAMRNIKTTAGTIFLPALSSVAQAFADTLNIVEDLIKSYKYLADPSLYNFDAVTSKSLKGIKAIEDKKLEEQKDELSSLRWELLRLQKPEKNTELTNNVITSYSNGKDIGNLSRTQIYENKTYLNVQKIRELEDKISQKAKEVEATQLNIADLEKRISDAVTRENAQREQINFTIKETSEELDKTIEKLDNKNSRSEGFFANLAKSVKVARNEIKYLEEERKQAQEAFEARAKEIGYWNDFIKADSSTQQNRLLNIPFKLLGIANSINIDYSKAIDNANTRHKTKEFANYAREQLTDGIANAVADGFASADFSGFASSLQSVISGVVGSGVSSSISEALSGKSSGNLGGLFKEVVTKNKDTGKTSISLGALGGNLLIGAGISAASNFLFGEGGIFGKRKIVGKENLNKSAELNAQVDQAKELAESIYLATGISEATRELIDSAVYNKTWTTSHKSKNIFKKKTTISLHGAEQAQASIKYVEDLQKQALEEQALNNYNNYMLGRDNSVGASYNTYQDAMSAYNASMVQLYSDSEKADFNSDIKAKEKKKRDLESYKKDAKKAYSNGYGGYSNGKYYSNTWKINNEINTLDSEITSLREKLNSSYKYDLETRTEMLQQMEEAHVNYIKAQQDARSNLLSNFTNSATLTSLMTGKSNGLMGMLLGDRDVAGNSSIIEAMLPMLEESYSKDYDLNKRLNSNDSSVRETALKEQQSILEQASSVYEKLYKDAKDEALNTDLSTEERSAAFERWQEIFQTYLSLQEQIADNVQTITDLEESNALSKLTTELGDMLSVVAEIANQKATNNTLVFRQSLSTSEIVSKVKEVVGAKNPELASILGEILDDYDDSALWG